MAERSVERTQASQQELDAYVREVGSSGGAASEVGKAKELLDGGAITQQEFDEIKAKALA
jgi:multidrug resistance efflux pump